MNNNKLNKKNSGSQQFENYYIRLWGKRWKKLRKALLSTPKYKKIGDKSFTKKYFINEGSYYPIEALQLKKGESFLDLCAAPGGKTLTSLLFLKGSGEIVANEFSKNRRLRLIRVLNEHLNENYMKSIKVTGQDACKWGMTIKEKYDKILVDAPCSSEAHTLSSPKYLQQWSPGRTKNLSIKQFAILASALEMVKPGGYIVYSTCSINQNENDDIIEKLLKKRPDIFTVIKMKKKKGMRTKYGIELFPDRNKGIGPIYFAKIRKNPLNQ